MSERRVALLKLIENIERLGQFQDRLDFPSSVNQIWKAFLVKVKSIVMLPLSTVKRTLGVVMILTPIQQSFNY